MAINFPTSEQEILNRVIADIQNELPEAGPFLRNNFVYALAVAFSARNFDNYQLLKEVLKQIFPDTATGDYLERWGGWVGVTRLSATTASGNITVTGLDGSVIPTETLFQTSDGERYISSNSGVVGLQQFSIASAVRSGNTVTVTTSGTHNLATGMLVSVTGADQTEYNDDFTITVTDTDEFIYTVDGTPATPATGTMLASYYGASIPVESESSGESANLENGTELSLVSPIAGVDTYCYVQFGEISGGTDSESDTRYRARVKYQWQNPVALFNEAAITSKAREVAGVDRVFVQDITPNVGQVTVYFTVDADNIIPTASDVSQVKTKLLTIKPANTDNDDVIVAAPTPVEVDFTISGLDPNTTTMQDAIQDSLETLFREETEVGVNLSRAAYLSAIYQTVDLETGDIVDSFSVTSPEGDVTISDGELAILGTITFTV